MSNPLLEDYSSLAIAQDAVNFMQSKFGQRYIERLKGKQAMYIEIVTNDSYTNDYRNSAGSKLSVVRAEIDYFKTAQTIIRNPSMLDKLKTKAKEVVKK